MSQDWDRTHPTEKLRKTLILNICLEDMSWLNSRFTTSITNKLDAWGSYNHMIAKIVESPEPSQLTAAQRLFGFKPAGSGAYSQIFVISEGSIFSEPARENKVPTQQNQYGEYLMAARYIDKLVREVFRKRLYDQLCNIYTGLSSSGWTSVYVFKPHLRSRDALQPTTRVVTSDPQFKNRFNVAAAAIKSFSPVSHVPFVGEMRISLLQRWIRRLFDILYPANGTFEQVKLNDLGPIVKGIWTCVRQYLVLPASGATSNALFPTLVVGHSIIMQLVMDEGCAKHTGRFDPQSLVCAEPTTPNDKPSIRNRLVSFYNWDDNNGLAMATYALRYGHNTKISLY